jgi:two-component system chemotaxis response regulator CheB
MSEDTPRLPQAIVIGASAGALQALSGLLPPLPADYPLPILIVVHIRPDRDCVLAHLFQSKCAIRVVEADDKEAIAPGTAYFAPPDYHLLVEQDHTLSLSSEEPVYFSRPAIDVLFESAADAYGEALIGIVLTGANEDGASGLKTIVDAGGTAIVQHPQGAYATAMPEAAIARCPQANIMTIEDISAFLLDLGRDHPGRNSRA